MVTSKSAARDSAQESKLEYERGKSYVEVTAVNVEDNSSFPSRGAFVLEAMGKNLIMVGR